MAEPRPTLSVSILAENGDVIVRCLKGGDVVLTVRNVADTESLASVHLSYNQSQTLADILQRAELDED